MSWHYKFLAEGKKEILNGIDVHMAQVDSDFLCELTSHMRQAVGFLHDAPGIAWVVESYGHVGAADARKMDLPFGASLDRRDQRRA